MRLRDERAVRNKLRESEKACDEWLARHKYPREPFAAKANREAQEGQTLMFAGHDGTKEESE